MTSPSCGFENQQFTYFKLFLFLTHFIPIVTPDDSFTVNSLGNKTVPVFWTLGDTGSSHKLRCIAEGTPSPTLIWMRGDDSNFTSGDNILIEESNPSDISLTFTSIDYEQIQDYYCVAKNPSGAGPSNYTLFKVLVRAPISNGTVFGWTVFLALFTVGVVGICRRFRLNDIATQIET